MLFWQIANLPNGYHWRVFRLLDKNAPGWKLTLRPENDLYQAICDAYQLECEEEFDTLHQVLRSYRWKKGKVYHEADLDHRFRLCHPVVVLTREQATIVKMFLPLEWGELKPYTMP